MVLQNFIPLVSHGMSDLVPRRAGPAPPARSLGASRFYERKRRCH
jgi:hypothetical protein